MYDFSVLLLLMNCLCYDAVEVARAMPVMRVMARVLATPTIFVLEKLCVRLSNAIFVILLY